MADADVTVWFNPNCSKCRGARDLLDEQGVTCELVRYLEDSPSRSEIERVMGLLGIDDPREMMRTGEVVYKELNKQFNELAKDLKLSDCGEPA